MNTETIYLLALQFLRGIGDINAKSLISYCQTAENVFKTPISKLKKIPGIGQYTIQTLKHASAGIKRAEEELIFIQKNNFAVIPYFSDQYPALLKHCADAPFILFSCGNIPKIETKIINIVGTRHATTYGKTIVEKLVEGLVEHGIIIASGLAYGIDIAAHKAAVTYGLPTIGVLAHGLDRIYPAAHKSIAKKMMEQGGLITEVPSGTNPDKQNFPRRNRIVAGMSAATIVIESATSGGAMITANIANSYNRDVFAFPGSIGSDYSAGCNLLIKENRAVLAENAADILKHLGWDSEEKINKKYIQKDIFIELDHHEQTIVHAIKNGKIYLEELCSIFPEQQSLIANILLQLEMKGVIQSLPGKRFRLVE